MKNWLGQDIEVGSWVYRGGGTSTSGTHVAVGVVLRFSGKENKPRVAWKFCPGNNGPRETSGDGSYPVDQLILFEGPEKDRLCLIDSVKTTFKEKYPEPEYSTYVAGLQSGPGWYNDPAYKAARKRYDDDSDLWTKAVTDEINMALTAAGFETI